MINSLKSTFSLIVLFLLFLGSAAAQDNRTDDPSPLLPDIDPQDIEIRGDFTARFAGIDRQPILGFNPTPRVFRIDPNRMPFLETPEEVVASVPLAQLEPQVGPPRLLMLNPDRSRIFGYAGFGMFNSPEADLYTSLPFSDNTRLHSRIHFSSSEGHLEDSPITNGAFRRFDGRATLRHKTSGTGSVLFHVNGRSDFSDLPFFPPNQMNLRSGINSGGAGIAWVNPISAFDHFATHASYQYAEINTSSTFVTSQLPPPVIISMPGDRVEHVLNAGGSRSWAGNRIGHIYIVEADARFSLFTIDQNDYERHTASLSGYWQHELQRGGKLRLGARVFSGSDPQRGQSFMAYPYLSFELQTTGGLRYKAVFSGDYQSRGLEHSFIENRTSFLGGPITNEHRFYGDMHITRDFGNMATLHLGMHASHTSRPRMYLSEYGSWTHPKELILLRPSAGFSFNVSPRYFNLYSEAHYNTTNLNDPDYDDFLNLEEYRITAGVRSAPSLNLNLKAWLDIIGPRKQGTGFKTTGNAILMNAMGEYRFGGNIGVYIKGINLLGQTYEFWPGYEERPLQVFGGITFKF